MLKNLLKRLIPFKVRRVLRKFQCVIRYRLRHVLYQIWIIKYDRLTTAKQKKLQSIMRNWAYQPLISIVIPVYKPEFKYFKWAVASIQQQLYQNWELILVEDGTNDPDLQKIMQTFAVKDLRIKPLVLSKNSGISGATNSGIALAQGEFIVFMDHDDLLSKSALYYVVQALQGENIPDVMYSDSDHINESNIRHVPYFKSAWDPYLILSQNYVSHLLVARKSLMQAIRGLRSEFDGSQDWDLILRLSEETSKIVHIPHILYHWRRFSAHESFSKAHLSKTMDAGKRAVETHLERRKIKATLSVLDSLPYHRVHFSLPEKLPLISILIPTKDGLALLKPCIDSIFKTAVGINFEIIIINNNSEKAETFAYLKQIASAQVRVLDYPHPFNYPALNNFAAREAKGEILLLLNNDIEAIHAGWLEEMLSLLLQPDVGVVGAKLYYPNNTIQHAGVVLGIQGTAFHIESGLPKEAAGYFSKLQLIHCFSAVTAACLMIKKSLYVQVSGMDEDLFPVTFNDIDLCLKVRALDYKIVWTPRAALYHKESATRGEDISGEKLARTLREAAAFKAKWGLEVIQNDPFYNPNLTSKSNDYALAFPPRRS